MATTASVALPFKIGPLNNIQPFTYRDGTSHMQLLEKLRVYINDVMRVEFNDEMDRIISEFQAAADAYAADNTATKAQWQALYEQFMADVTAQLRTMTDEEMADLVTDENSLFGTAMAVLMDDTITPAAQQAAATYVGSQPAVVAAAAAAVDANPAIATLTANIPWKGILADGTDFDTLRTPGIYSVATSASAETMIDCPIPYSGLLKVFRPNAGNITVQEYVASGSNGYTDKYSRITRSATEWTTAWYSDRAMNGVLPAATNVGTFRTPGEWIITPEVAATLTGMPVGLDPNYNGILSISAGPVSLSPLRSQTLRIIPVVGGTNRYYARVGIGGTLGTWDETTPSANNGTVAARDFGPYKHLDILGRARMRRGGTIYTGKAAVGIRLDHHLVPLRDNILPLLKKYNLPWTVVVNPERVNSYATDLMPFAELQSMMLDNGGELGNHGGNHGDATSEAALRQQIVDSITALRTGVPELPVEGWAPPGITAGGYMGASPFDTVTQNSETYAGQLITGNHAFVAGYSDGLYRVLDGSPAIGAPHYTLDAATPAAVATHLDTIIERDAGLGLMLHPNLVGTVGYITLADLETVFADIATRRDAGTLEVISYWGLWLASARTGARHDMAPKASRAANTGVLANTGHAVTVSGYQRKHEFGATKEAHYVIDAPSAGSMTIAVTGKPTTTHTLKPGRNIIRRPVTIGINSGNVTFTTTPTVAVTVAEFHVYAI